jgi:hypothetical protein
MKRLTVVLAVVAATVFVQHPALAQSRPAWTHYPEAEACWNTGNAVLSASEWCQFLTSSRQATTPVPCISNGQVVYRTGYVRLRWANQVTGDDGTLWAPSYTSGWDNTGCWFTMGRDTGAGSALRIGSP